MKQLIASYRNWTFRTKAMAYQSRIQVSGHEISNDLISHKFNLEGQQFKHFSLACNGLFHKVHLTQQYFSDHCAM